MSIDYNGKFGEVGKLVKKTNSLTVLGSTTLPADLAEILGAYGTTNTGVSNAQGQVSGLSDAYAGLMNTVAQMRQLIANYATPTITDFDTVVSQLKGASSQDLNLILLLLYQDMLDNSQTVTRSTVTVGSVTADPSNIGTGTVLVDKQLDGFQAPVSGGLVNPRYAGVASEMAPPSVTHAFTCTADSYSGGTQQGAETFGWDDGVAFGPFAGQPEGFGSGPSLQAAGASSLVPNGSFANWAGNVPSGYTLAAGTAGVNVLRDQVLFYGQNTSSLKLTGGTRAAATIKLTAPVPQGALSPRRRYNLSFRAIRTGGSSSGVLNVKFTATGYTASAGEQINIAVSAIPTTWTLFNFYWTVPANIANNVQFQVSVNNTLVGQVNLANAFLMPVSYAGGVNAVVIPGDQPFTTRDRFYCAVTNDGAGLFQEFFRQQYLMQLPSAPATSSGSYAFLPHFSLFTGSGVGGPTLPNSLCL